MPLVYPNTAPETASDIVRAIQRNNDNRYHGLVSRRSYLARHADLRRRLSYTTEYKALRQHVWERSGGRCEKCKAAPAKHLAHKLAVAMYPKLALDEKNVYYACVECHQLDHPHIKLER